MQSSRGWCGVALQSASAGLGPWGLLGVWGSGLARAAVRCARWRLAVQVAANAVRGPQGGAIHVGHGLQAVSRRTGRALCARGQLCPWLSAGSARRHRTLEKAGQVYNKKTHGRRPWQAGRSTQTQRYAGRAPSRHAGNAPAKGAWPVRTAQMQRSGKTGEPPTPPWPKRPKLPQWAHRYNTGWEGRAGLAQRNPRPGSERQEAWQAAAVTACWVSLQQLALSTLGLRK